MSIEITNTTINAAKKITERTYYATQTTPLGDDSDGVGGISGYTATIRRERVMEIEGIDPVVLRESEAPVVGEPAEGTDGNDPSHYVNAQAGFDTEITVQMTDVMAYDPSETVTATHPDPTIGTVTVPAAVVPLLLASIYDLVSQKHNQGRLDALIAKAVAKAQIEHG